LFVIHRTRSPWPAKCRQRQHVKASVSLLGIARLLRFLAIRSLTLRRTRWPCFFCFASCALRLALHADWAGSIGRPCARRSTSAKQVNMGSELWTVCPTTRAKRGQIDRRRATARKNTAKLEFRIRRVSNYRADEFYESWFSR
jgi:hypothetical protein